MTTRAMTNAAIHDPTDWIEPLARAGYAARGIIYLLIGGLALLSVFGQGGSTEGSRGALETLMNSPGGWIVLFLIGIGLLGYALWRFVQGVYDIDRHGREAKGLVVRGAFLFSAVTHVGLAVWAIGRAIGYAQSGSGGNDEVSWTAWLMGLPLGRWLVAAVGGAILCVAIFQIVKGWKASFKKRLNTRDDVVRKLTPVCRFGLIARGIAFALIAGFFIYAAWTYDPSKAGGLEEAFDTVRGVVFGQILLALLATGFVAFAIYSFIEAYYRRINAPT